MGLTTNGMKKASFNNSDNFFFVFKLFVIIQHPATALSSSAVT